MTATSPRSPPMSCISRDCCAVPACRSAPPRRSPASSALSLIDLGNRTEARTALRTAMIHRHEHQDVFDQAFNLFWRDPTAAEQAAAMALLDAQKDKPQERPPPGSRRVAEAMAKPRETKPRPRTNRR